MVPDSLDHLLFAQRMETGPAEFQGLQDPV